LPSSQSGFLQLPGRVQPLIAGLVAASLLAMAGWYVASGGFSGRLVHHDRPPAATATFTVDVNAAPAVELAQLPGLGPATAARIVDHRQQYGPFTSPESLLAVPGIGPVTLEAIRPHLRALAPRMESP
jgi:competence ComEA-like helix-hairpin-helix protein